MRRALLLAICVGYGWACSLSGAAPPQPSPSPRLEQGGVSLTSSSLEAYLSYRRAAVAALAGLGAELQPGPDGGLSPAAARALAERGRALAAARGPLTDAELEAWDRVVADVLGAQLLAAHAPAQGEDALTPMRARHGAEVVAEVLAHEGELRALQARVQAELVAR